MNLNSSPTLTDLQAIFASANDEDGHHCLWIDVNGNVHLSLIPQDQNPVGFERGETSMRMRYETFESGNDYVGPAAASDQKLMKRLLKSLQTESPRLH